MTDPTTDQGTGPSATASKNEAAERLRIGLHNAAPENFGYVRSVARSDLDAALSEERRRVRDLLLSDDLLTSNRLVSERIACRLDELEEPR